MATSYCSVQIVHGATGSSAVGLSAYIARTSRVDAHTGETFDFRQGREDLIHHAVLMAGGPESFQDGETLWNAAQRAEIVTDRKTGDVRYRSGAQVARHVVMSLPWEDDLSDTQRVALARSFAETHWVGRGVAVEMAVHRYGSEFDPDNPKDADAQRALEVIRSLGLDVIRIEAGRTVPVLEGPHVIETVLEGGGRRWRMYQPHAHFLISTRHLGPEGFTTKATDLNPRFARGRGAGSRGYIAEQDLWHERWRAHQETFFRVHGLSLAVAPDKAVPETKMGKARSVRSGAVVENRTRDAECQAAMMEPAEILAAVTRHKAVFTRRDMERVMAVNGIFGAERDELVAAVLADAEALRLHDGDTGEAAEVFTTRSVRRQEREILERLAAIHARRHAVAPAAVTAAAAARSMDGEQLHAFRRAVGAEGLVIVQGDAGTGKSYAMGAVRDAHERAGYRVVGCAPTNTVAADLRRDGFREADTLHATLWRLERGRTRWSRRTAVLVDEAAMVDADLYDRLSRQALAAGAKLVIVGDDKQLPSVTRGGLYTEARRRFGAERLTTVRRQEVEWQRQATQDFAAGRVAEALGAYAERGFVHWTATTQAARLALVRQWAADSAADPGRNRFVYAATNREVDALNQALRAVREMRGEVAPGREFKTVRGAVRLAPGDRVQMHGNRKREGIHNGTLGTVVGIGGEQLTVRFDAGHTAVIDARHFQEFGLG
ncbi:AAA family ATPase [Azospirillum sp.]|uniref:AAA family ATPase n=1 Tax=Azospirillum sp. TaxID=34012 RepID=UPI002D50D284|nr:AAA family ATPase [Azospirillum sp.]HYD63937.1 AAA family ATPase [Azospirillum sp.]